MKLYVKWHKNVLKIKDERKPDYSYQKRKPQEEQTTHLVAAVESKAHLRLGYLCLTDSTYTKY